jgi:hypothetical protein
MSTTKNLQLARFLKIVLDIIFGGLVLVSVFLVIWIAGFGLISRQPGNLSTASIPVILGSSEEGQVDVTMSGNPIDNIHAAFLNKTEGTLRLETDSALLVGIANAAKLILAIGLAYIAYLLREIVKAIRDGDPFMAKNTRQIRQLGYTVLVLGFVGPGVEYLAANEILNRLPPTIPVLNPGPTFDSWTIMVALFILLLANIWSYGLELEHDRSLTI